MGFFTLQAPQLQAALMMDDWRDALSQVVAVMTQCNATHEIRGDLRIIGNLQQFNQTEVNIPTLDLNGPIRWARALSNWVNASGNNSYVDCLQCDDQTGLNPTTAVRVYLPRSGKDEDPNVEAGNIIPYQLDTVGKAQCTSSLDGKIGEYKGWTGTVASIPQGWRLMDGTSNDTAIDTRLRFIMGLDSGTPNGALLGTDLSLGHSHGGVTGLGGSHSHTITVNSNVTGITVDPHGDHTHEFTATTVTVVEGTPTVDPEAHLAGNYCTANVTDSASLCTVGSNALTHVVNDSGHAHTASSDTVTDHTHTIDSDGDNPLHIKLYWIERINNSA